MIHPLIDLSAFKDNEIENKIQDLSKKYFMHGSDQIKMQIVQLLDIYKNELHVRRSKIYEEQFAKTANKGLDSLININ